MSLDRPLVSVVTIFLNAEDFLAEAIESVLAQTYPAWELLLVDDGSTDRSSEIAREYTRKEPDRIRYLEHLGHANRGMPASRNLGFAHARGDLIALLDADDVWLPHKLERQVAILKDHQAVSLVCGRPLYWFSWSGKPEHQQADVAPRPGVPLNAVLSPPEALVRSYPLAIGSAPCPSDLVFRRSLLDAVGGFEESFSGVNQLYEDQAFLAKAYLAAPIYVANECWLLYRQHESSYLATMLRGGEYDSVRRHYLGWLERYAENGGSADAGVRHALRQARAPYDYPMKERLRELLSTGRRLTRKAMSRFLPESLVSLMPRSFSPGQNHPARGRVRFGNLGRVTPISTAWGWDRGLPVDRYYIERFLEGNAELVRGHVLEVGDDRYTPRFGAGRVERLDILHVTEGNPKATIVGDLCAADHIPSDSFDCIVLTQTLQYVYDLPAAFRTLHRILKPGGVLLATVPGVTRTEEEIDPPRLEHAERWKDARYWSFTRASLERLAGESFPPHQVKVESFGNVWAAAAFLYGIAAEELSAETLDTWDPAFPVLIALSARKTAGAP